MTLLPAEDQRIGKGIKGGVAVRLPPVCMMPACHEQMNVERHHVVRRSHLGGPFDAVEIDGKVMPNVVTLCHKHHLTVTDNLAKITYDNEQWWWVNELGKVVDPLIPQPVLFYLEGEKPRVEWHGPGYGPADRQFHPKHEDDKTCPRCHGKGKVPKEKKLPKTPRKYKTWSMGIPVDAGENGFEIWKMNLDACSERVQGILGYSDSVPPYYVLVAVCSDWLNTTDQEQ